MKPATDLLSLKGWLTVPEAAKRLSSVLGEEVSEADVLLLALNDQLALSVQFVNPVKAIQYKRIPIEDARVITGLRGTPVILGIKLLNSDSVLDSTDGDTLHSLTGVWDLPMIGGERLDVKWRYQLLVGGPEVTSIAIDGTFVVAGETYFQIQARFDKESPHKGKHYPAGGFPPEDSMFVVRASAIRDFEGRISMNNQPLLSASDISAYANVSGWPLMGAWDIDLAAWLISVGGSLDIEATLADESGSPPGAVLAGAYGRCLSIAKADVAGGLIADSQAPTEWLQWAETKGYDTSHLAPFLAGGSHPSRGLGDSTDQVSKPEDDDIDWLPVAKMADALKDLGRRSESQWQSFLSDTPKWLAPARRQGRRGSGRPSTWNPRIFLDCANKKHPQPLTAAEQRTLIGRLPEDWRERIRLLRKIEKDYWESGT